MSEYQKFVCLSFVLAGDPAIRYEELLKSEFRTCQGVFVKFLETLDSEFSVTGPKGWSKIANLELPEIADPQSQLKAFCSEVKWLLQDYLVSHGEDKPGFEDLFVSKVVHAVDSAGNGVKRLVTRALNSKELPSRAFSELLFRPLASNTVEAVKRSCSKCAQVDLSFEDDVVSMWAEYQTNVESLSTIVEAVESISPPAVCQTKPLVEVNPYVVVCSDVSPTVLETVKMPHQYAEQPVIAQYDVVDQALVGPVRQSELIVENVQVSLGETGILKIGWSAEQGTDSGADITELLTEFVIICWYMREITNALSSRKLSRCSERKIPLLTSLKSQFEYALEV